MSDNEMETYVCEKVIIKKNKIEDSDKEVSKNTVTSKISKNNTKEIVKNVPKNKIKNKIKSKTKETKETDTIDADKLNEMEVDETNETNETDETDETDETNETSKTNEMNKTNESEEDILEKEIKKEENKMFDILREKFHKFKEFESEFQPNDEVFRYVWYILYALYAISFFTSLKSTGCRISLGIGLGLNLLWIVTFLFFNNPVFSLGVLSLQLILAIDSIFRLFKEKKNVQGIFICVYLVWLLFAFYLNFVIVKNYYELQHDINPTKYIKKIYKKNIQKNIQK